jgi:hypothetical protein
MSDRAEKERLWADREHVYDLLILILEGQTKIMTALSDLQAAVAAEETQEAAVLTYLQGVPALIAAAVAAVSAGTDTAALEALTSQITADTAKLAAGESLAPAEPLAAAASQGAAPGA